MKPTVARLVLAAALIALPLCAGAGGTVEDHRFFSKSLNRMMACRVYLPGGYDRQNPDKKYPSVVFLHGATLGYTEYDLLYPILDNLIQFGLISPMIVVLPDGLAEPYNGSFYTNSELYGNFEDFISNDLIAFMDSAFHTFPEKTKRAVMGASMGGYGALKQAIRHQDLYIGVASHSGPVNLELLDQFIPGLISESGGGPPYRWSPGSGKSLTNLTFTMAGAFSPNLSAPFKVDFPLDSLAQPVASVMERWRKHNIAAIIRDSIPYRQLGITFDCGNADEYQLQFHNRSLADTLTKYNVRFGYEEYTGTHTSGLAIRVPLSLIYFDYLFKNGLTGLVPDELPDPFRIYPNPAGDYLYVTCGGTLQHPDQGLFELIDATGKPVFEFRLTGGKDRIPIPGLSKGWYIYRITGYGKPRFGKVILN